MWIRSLAFLAWIFVCVAELSAQGPDERSGGCFEGRPLAMCKMFWITDFTVTMRLLDDERRNLRSDIPLMTWELGAMINVTPRSALGTALFLGIDGNGTLVGVRTRYRRWLAGANVLDLAVGLYISQALNPPHAHNTPTVTGQLDLGSDAFAFIGRVDLFGPLRCGPNAPSTCSSSVGWNVGAKLGSRPGLATGLLVPVVALLVGMIVCGVGGCGY